MAAQILIVAAVLCMFGLRELTPLICAARNPLLSLILVVAGIALVSVLAFVLSRRGLSRLACEPKERRRLALFYKRLGLGLHIVLLLIFAGDIAQDEAISLAKRTLGGWKIGLVEMGLVLPDLAPAKPTQIYIVDRPGSMQSEIRIGQLGITRHQQPDYFISRIVTLYFGGSFNSRLNRAVRVERGLTYGARGGYYPMNMAGVFRIGTFTKNESTAETVKVIFEQIKRLQDEPPEADVLADTKSFFAGSFVRDRETPQAVAADLWLVESQRLGADYLERLMAAIAEATAQQSADFARRTLDAEKMVVVVVGDAEKIKADLEAIAPVTVIKDNAN